MMLRFAIQPFAWALFAISSLMLFLTTTAQDSNLVKAVMSGDQEVPPVTSNVRGIVSFTLTPDGSTISFTADLTNPDGVALLGASGAHIHCAAEGANGPIVAFLAQPIPGGNRDPTLSFSGAITQQLIINPLCGSTPSLLFASMGAEATYVNVHSSEHPSGEVRGQTSEVTVFAAVLTGRKEVPPIRTLVFGSATVEYSGSAFDYSLTITNVPRKAILGAAGAHLHCAPEGQNGPIILYLAQPVTGGVTTKHINLAGTLTNADIVDTSCGATIDDIADSIENGGVYVNVHSSENPSGEIRGQLVAK